MIVIGWCASGREAASTHPTGFNSVARGGTPWQGLAREITVSIGLSCLSRAQRITSAHAPAKFRARNRIELSSCAIRHLDRGRALPPRGPRGQSVPRMPRAGRLGVRVVGLAAVGDGPLSGARLGLGEYAFSGGLGSRVLSAVRQFVHRTALLDDRAGFAGAIRLSRSGTRARLEPRRGR